MKIPPSLAARMLAVAALALVTASHAAPAAAQVITHTFETCDMISADCAGSDVKLLQPLDDETASIPASDVPLETFFTYFNMSWPWLIGVASGISVLQAVWGGVLIMTSWDRDAGKEKIEWALGGMVMIALAGFILRFLNSMFYA
jgi:hypothetical protein